MPTPRPPHRLLPRCIEHIFEQVKGREGTTSFAVTYLEIYNDTAFDLLNAASGGNARLPKVTVADSGATCRVHNLTTHPAPDAEVATNLLFVGKTNRTVVSVPPAAAGA